MEPLSLLVLATTIEDDRRRQRDRQRIWQPNEGPAAAPTPSRSSSLERPRLNDLPAHG